MKKILWTTYILFFFFIIYYGLVASRTFDGAVDKPYDKGMAYPAKMARLEELGWHFKADAGWVLAGRPGDFTLTVTGKDNAPVRGARVTLEISRPAGPETLPPVQAAEAEPGRYVAGFTVPEYGHWLFSVKIDKMEDEFDYEYKIYAAPGGTNANG